MGRERGVVDMVVHVAVAVAVDTWLVHLKSFAIRVGCAVLGTTLDADPMTMVDVWLRAAHVGTGW
eukprot:SAG11_NODE_31745_length_289_cov_1.094737_1_plen_64_part_10